MTGRHWTTTSPSSTSSSRSTPCVDGCCGPMLTVNSSRCSLRVSVAAIHVSGDGEVDRLGAERLGPAQRVALPVVGQHDAAQVRVTVEADPEQVEHLALVPVGAGDSGGQA